MARERQATSAHRAAPQTARSFSIVSVAVLVVITVIGLVYIYFPIDHDQALFTYGARVLHDGGALYRDIWDVKQPGIYYFYLLAGSAFGFSETGIYAFEALYLLVFSVVLILTLKRYFSSPVVAACVPLFTIAFYYGSVSEWHRGQVESVVGFPLFFALWFALRAEESELSSRSSLFWSGFFGGIVLLLKLFLLPILLVIWLPTIVAGNKRSPTPGLRLTSRSVISILVGAALPILTTVAYLAFQGTLEIFLWTTFVWPALHVAEAGRAPMSRLVRNGRWFFQTFAPSLALAVVALSPVASRRIDPLNRNLLLWFICGLVLILLQVRSWFQYHYVLLLIPVGILAARGVDGLWSHSVSEWGEMMRARLRLLLILAIVFLYFGPIVRISIDSIDLLRDGVPVTPATLRRIQGRFSNESREVIQDARFLSEPGSEPGPIYVCGHPFYYLLSGRREAAPLPGVVLRTYVPKQQAMLLDQLRRSRPSYILVSPLFRSIIDERFQSFQTFIDDHYRELRKSHAGVWYIINQRSEPTG